MPDPLKDEETEAKMHSLLFNSSGSTCRSNRRYDNCPGASRTPLYYQKRSPLDSLENNSFNPAGAAAESWKSEVDSKNELGADAYYEHTEEVQNPKCNKLGAFFPVEGYSDTGAKLMQNHPKTFQEPHVDIVVELKAADSSNQPGSSLRTELGGVSSLKASVLTTVDERAIEFRDGSSDVKEYLRNKPQNIFQDLQEDEPLFLEGSLTGVPASWSSLMKFFDGNPNDMQENHILGKASSFGICVPGFEMIAGRQGVRTSYNRVFNENDREENVVLAMDLTEEPSIDQIELRIEGSSFF